MHDVWLDIRNIDSSPQYLSAPHQLPAWKHDRQTRSHSARKTHGGDVPKAGTAGRLLAKKRKIEAADPTFNGQ